MTPKEKGIRTEVIVMERLILKGKAVSIPFGDNQRYDLILDDNGNLQRVQCKTGRYKHGVIHFNAASVHDHRGTPSQKYTGQADLFAVYCEHFNNVYLIPVSRVNSFKGRIRVTQGRKRATPSTIWAHEMLLA